MILTSYLDESGTHGGDVTIMAGFLADARQWRKFEKRTIEAVRSLPRRYFSRHGRESAATRILRAGRLIGRSEFLDEFQHIINETTEMGYAAILLEKDYQVLPLAAVAAERRGRMPDTRFCSAPAWRTRIDGILSIDRLKYRSEPRLHVALESGGPNPGDVIAPV